MNRRELLRSLAASAMMKTGKMKAMPSHDAPSEPSLKAIFKQCGGLIGTQAGRSVLQQQRPMTDLIVANSSIITPGNDMKWSALRPTTDSFRFTDTDWDVAFCRSRGIAVHGHNLCWNEDNPAWLRTTVNKTNGEKLLSDHIKTVVGRYRGRIDSWDVVNEPIAVWHNRPGGLRTGPWLDSLGAAYIDIAFHAAAEADPDATRVMNLNHVEQEEKDIQVSREMTLKLLSGMMTRKVPLQAVGLESHLDISRPLDLQAFSGFVQEIIRMGLPVMITEMDIFDSSGPPDITSRDAVVARYYSEYLDCLLPLASPKRLIFWSLTDYGNWYDNIPNLRRLDQQPHRPGLFDVQLQPKSAFQAVVKSLQIHCQ
jgi:endo-1,4-beta-xylanase